MFGRHWYAKHWNRGVGGQHTRQVRGPTGAGNDAGYPVGTRALCKLSEQIGGAVRGYDLRPVINAKFLEVFDRTLHHGPITIAAHDDGDHWVRHDFLRYIPKKRAIIPRNRPKKPIIAALYANICGW
jgi:hypothetical protein